MKTDSKNRIYSGIAFLLCLFGCLRFAFGAQAKDPDNWIMIGDPFYLIGDRVIISLLSAAVEFLGSSICICFILGKNFNLTQDFSLIRN